MSSEIRTDSVPIPGKTVNDMSIREAAKYYASLGIVTHPLSAGQDKGNTPGKKPLLPDWQLIEHPLTDNEIDSLVRDDKNLGYVCGNRSNLLVADFDWFRKGIWQYIFRNVDTSGFVKVSHTEGKCHLLFQYSGKIDVGKFKLLGFMSTDLLQ